jgi:signal transduction histidine kinase
VSQSPALMEKRIKLEQEFDPAVNGLLIRGDPYLLELAVAAILQNASEATSAGGKIKLKASVNSRDGISVSARLVIIDDGIGIEPCDLSKVTLPFFSTKANHDGLGLSMAARFVELHRGALKVKSESGEGVTVEVILPLNVDVDEGCR